MKIFNFLKTILKEMLDLIFAGIAFVLLFQVAWIFGHSIVDGGALVGNDSAFAISLMVWFNKFWPRVPLWYPLQGAGVSLYHSYPMLTTFLGILMEKITNLTFVEIYRILSFAAFPLTSWGIYVFARYKTKNQIAAFFAGVFFLLSQASWVFQRLHGIFAQSFSLVFVPWSFLFFDIWLSKNIEKKNGLSQRLALLLGVVFTALAFLTHVVTGMVVVVSLVAYAIVYSQTRLGVKFNLKKRFKDLINTALLTAVYLGLAISLAAFWLVPFFSYNKLANREGLLTMNMGQLQEVSLKPQTLLGYGDFATGDLRYDYFFFALPVLVLTAVGLLGGFLSQKSMLAWGLVGVGALIFTTLPLYAQFLVILFKYLFTAIYFRALIAAIVVLPVVAAFGALFMVDLPWLVLARFLRDWWGRGKRGFKTILRFTFFSARWLTVSAGVALVAVIAINKFEHKPPSEATSQRPAYGITQFDAYGPTLGGDIKLIKDNWSELFKRPEIEISKTGLEASPGLIGFINDFNLNQQSRVDVSAYSGESFLQYAPILTDASFVNLYHYSASIIHRMWGYQQGVFYGQEKLYDNPQLLRDLSKWFGIEYAVLVPGYDREENYLSVGWELVKPGGSAENRLPIYKFKDASGMLSVSRRPVALVIGSLEDAAYDQVFKTANAGAFPYDDMWLVDGGEEVDAYTLSELKKFDLLILHGYDYRNRSTAWKLISDYVKGGGSVFIDTGWQYVAADWGDKGGSELQLPEPAPVKQVLWSSIGPDWTTVEISPKLGKFNTDNYKPLSWNNGKWGASIANKDMLREGAEVLMSEGENVVLAQRSYGQGKIVWSGMNLISHSQGPDGEKEVDFINKIFSRVIGDRGEDYLEAGWARNYPDNLSIVLAKPAEGVWILWREAYSPNWRASLADSNKKIKLYRAGPGFMLAYLEKIDKGEVLNLSYRLGWFEGPGAKAISILSALIVILYSIIGGKTNFAKKLGFSKISERLKGKFQQIAREENEVY